MNVYALDGAGAHRRQRVGRAVGELRRGAAVLLPGDAERRPHQGGEADGGHGALGDHHLVDLLIVPDGSGAHKGVAAEYQVDEGQIHQRPVFPDLDALGRRRALRRGDHAPGQRRGGHSGHGALHQLRIDVVGTSGHGDHRHPPGALGGGPAGSVAPHDDQHVRPDALHLRGKEDGVCLGLGAVHVVDLQLGQIPWVAAGVPLLEEQAAVAQPVGHEADALLPHRGGRQENPLQNVQLLHVVDGGGRGEQAADVLARLGIAGDSDQRHRRRPSKDGAGPACPPCPKSFIYASSFFGRLFFSSATPSTSTWPFSSSSRSRPRVFLMARITSILSGTICHSTMPTGM